MRPEFIENMYRLAAANEGDSWEYRNGHDSVAISEKVAKKLIQKYGGHMIANTKYVGDGPYSKLDPEMQAAVDMYIIENNLIGL